MPSEKFRLDYTTARWMFFGGFSNYHETCLIFTAQSQGD